MEQISTNPIHLHFYTREPGSGTICPAMVYIMGIAIYSVNVKGSSEGGTLLHADTYTID